MTTPWQPTASITSLQKRAAIINQIRNFFTARNVLEVETPLLSHATVTDPYIHSIPAHFFEHGATEPEIVYLQTSPEYAMKRLLAAGSGPIFQICKAFRQGDLGRLHNPEFTMLEWYRPGYDHHALMNEMDELLQIVLVTKPAKRFTYAAIFQQYANVDPHAVSDAELQAKVSEVADLASPITDRTVLLDILFTYQIEPNMSQESPIFVYDYPVDQAALAKIRFNEGPPVASRFEVYFKGIELANGFHELQDASEQKNRFIKNLEYRTQHGLPDTLIDDYFLAALAAGLPDCAGVALGVDRLVMLALGFSTLSDCMCFNYKRS